MTISPLSVETTLSHPSTVSLSLHKCYQSYQKSPTKAISNLQNYTISELPLDFTLTEGGQQYPCSQKDAEECFSRPHTPLPPSTHNTLSLFQSLQNNSIKISDRCQTDPTGSKTVICCQRDWLIKTDDIFYNLSLDGTVIKTHPE